MPGLVKALVACGAMPKKKTGPANPMSPEERLQVRYVQNKAAAIRRRALIAEAKAQGLPPPVFQRGRPRKYFDEKTAHEAKQRQSRQSLQERKERVKLANEILKQMSAEQFSRLTV
jgi:hypothetical protein